MDSEVVNERGRKLSSKTCLLSQILEVFSYLQLGKTLNMCLDGRFKVKSFLKRKKNQLIIILAESIFILKIHFKIKNCKPAIDHIHLRP